MGKTREERVKYSGKKDRISDLPDELIATILSFLSSKNATRTSLLSKRWTYLWTLVPCLNFEFNILPAIWKSSSPSQCTGEECDHYVRFRSLTQFFWLHQGTLDRITMSVSSCGYGLLCPNTLMKIIPAWIELVEPKRVQSLEIDLYSYTHYGQASLLKPFIETPVGISCIKYLKHLSLKGPGISSEIVQHFLSNSPLLENLTISRWRGYSNLKVCGSSSLKFLQISDSEYVDHHQVEISAPNLVSFIHNGVFKSDSGPESLIVLKHAPSLVNLSYSPKLVTSIPACTKGFLCFSSFLHQLETLNLGCRDYKPDHGNQWIRDILLPENTELTSLKNLSLSIRAYPFEKTLLNLASWIERSPFLRSFTLEIKWRKMPSSEKEIQKLKRLTHQYLKVVKICGFVGYGNDMELALYLVENAMVLEKIIIEPYEVLPPWASRWEKDQKPIYIRRSTIEGKAKWQLKEKLPPGAKLCFL